MNFHLRPYNQYILNIVTNIYLGLDYYKKSEDGKRLADSIHNQMKTLTGTRKNISSSSIYILRATQSL